MKIPLFLAGLALQLEADAGPLTLRTVTIPGHQVMDVRGITLTLQP